VPAPQAPRSCRQLCVKCACTRQGDICNAEFTRLTCASCSPCSSDALNSSS
jgi:hypothetical protein